MKDTQLNTYRAAPRWMFPKTNTDEDLGRDPARIQDRWQTLYRGGLIAVSGVMTTAAWRTGDIRGYKSSYSMQLFEGTFR